MLELLRLLLHERLFIIETVLSIFFQQKKIYIFLIKKYFKMNFGERF